MPSCFSEPSRKAENSCSHPSQGQDVMVGDEGNLPSMRVLEVWIDGRGNGLTLYNRSRGCFSIQSKTMTLAWFPYPVRIGGGGVRYRTHTGVQLEDPDITLIFVSFRVLFSLHRIDYALRPVPSAVGWSLVCRRTGLQWWSAPKPE